MSKRSGSVALLAIVAGTAMASNYVLQPVLPAVGRSFPTTPWIVSLSAGAGPLGYMLGLWWLVPLGDSISLRKLAASQAVTLAICLAVAATATNPALFLLALLCGGIASTVTAHCVVVARCLCPDQPGRGDGTVVMGISTGILPGRVLSGLLAVSFGWRAPMTVLALLMALGGLVLHVMVPPMPPAGRKLAWRDLALGVPRTLVAKPALRRATAGSGGCLCRLVRSGWHCRCDRGAAGRSGE